MAEPPAPARSGTELTPAIAAALLVLAGSFALSVGFVVANGGMTLPTSASSSPVAAQGPGTNDASQAPAASPSTGGPEATTAPSAAASSGAALPPASQAPSLAPTPVRTEAPTSAPTASPSSTPTARPTSDRYALLTPCGDEANCWVYVVRKGDNLVSIARYFGVPLEVVYDRNPWAETTLLVAGQELRLPAPTR